MIHSLNKGRRAEREVIGLLQPILDHVWGTVKLQAPQLERRGLGLSGQDIVGLEWLSLEVKHRETLQLNQWWQQAEEQAKRRNNGKVTPALVYKRNNVPWRVRLPGFAGQQGAAHTCIVDISMEDFQYWVYYRALRELELETDSRAR